MIELRLQSDFEMVVEAPTLMPKLLFSCPQSPAASLHLRVSLQMPIGIVK